jgi:hypothetical protein
MDVDHGAVGAGFGEDTVEACDHANQAVIASAAKQSIMLDCRVAPFLAMTKSALP